MDFDDWEYLSDGESGNVKGLISIDMDYFQKLMDPPKELEVDPIGAPPNPIPEGDQVSLTQFADIKLDSPTPQTELGRPQIGQKEEDFDCGDDKGVFGACKGDDQETLDEFADMKLDSFAPQTELGRPQFGEKEEGSDCGDDKGVLGACKGDDQDTLDEFADMKLDSPTPQTELGRPQFGEKEEGFGCGEDKGVFGKDEEEEEELEEGKNGGGLSIWKVGITGFGALCSFGVVFATICVIAIGTRNRARHRDQNLHFQMYTHERRFKQVVHHATRLNGAISVARGVPLSRAHISIGGYFEGL